ncbi:MAG: hypothetical protein WC707_04120 [Candidatus Babeliaceae bacterium]
MKLHVMYIFGVVLLTMTSCMHRTTEDVFSVAYNDYMHLNSRYYAFLQADDATIAEEARLVARDCDVPLSAYLWESFVGNDHLTASQGAPLHKAVYIMQRDSNLLDSHIRRFEQRGLFDRPLYNKLRDFRHDLLVWMRIVEKQKTFSQESQFIEQQRIQKNQLYEQKKQTQLLEDIARDKPKKACHKEHKKHEHVHVQSYNVYL